MVLAPESTWTERNSWSSRKRWTGRFFSLLRMGERCGWVEAATVSDQASATARAEEEEEVLVDVGRTPDRRGRLRPEGEKRRGSNWNAFLLPRSRSQRFITWSADERLRNDLERCTSNWIFVLNNKKQRCGWRASISADTGRPGRSTHGCYFPSVCKCSPQPCQCECCCKWRASTVETEDRTELGFTSSCFPSRARLTGLPHTDTRTHLISRLSGTKSACSVIRLSLSFQDISTTFINLPCPRQNGEPARFQTPPLLANVIDSRFNQLTQHDQHLPQHSGPALAT